MSDRTRNGRLTRWSAATALTAVMALAAVACGSDDQANPAGDTDTDATTQASALAGDGGGDVTRGEQLSRSSGCAGCHGQDFQGGAGPDWIGLAGSEVTLADGTTTIADTAYLTRAIANPSAELVADYSLRMPANGLSDAEIADIVAFIESLADG